MSEDFMNRWLKALEEAAAGLSEKEEGVRKLWKETYKPKPNFREESILKEFMSDRWLRSIEEERTSMVTRTRWGTWPETHLTNTDRDAYDVRTILNEVLEQRTGNQGWFTVSDFAYDIDGRRIRSMKALYANNARARRLWNHINNTSELKALKAIDSPIPDEPTFGNCQDWDDQTWRGILALYWTKEAEKFEKWVREDRSPSIWQPRADEARAKARAALSNVSVQRCYCGQTHEHAEGPEISLPTPADVRRLIEDVVDKHLVKFLLSHN